MDESNSAGDFTNSVLKDIYTEIKTENMREENAIFYFVFDVKLESG
jgi:hypothetical protein